MRINGIYALFFAVATALAIVSCGEDRTYEYLEKTEENQWTYSKMKEVYLWADEIGQPERSAFFATTSKFFESLLAKNDNSSFFTDSVTAGSYGLTCALMRDPLAVKLNRYYAVVLYVEPGSPAAATGIERGTWISGINGKALTSTSGKMLLSGDALELATNIIEYDDENGKYLWVPGDTLSMRPSCAFESEPIYVDSIYNVRTSKVGYIVCRNLNAASFAADVQDVMLGFAAGEVSDIVVDLRYCNGGTLENASTLASALVPQSLAGTPFAMLVGRDESVDSVCNYVAQPVNLSDKKLFFVTGGATRGAAELLVASVNASRGIHEVVVVGSKSAGENLITRKFDSPYGFSINPAVAVMCSSDGEQLSADGIFPDYSLDELEEPEHIYRLGNEQEYILRNIEYLIVNGSLPTEN